jgi:hypothetical protein
MPCTLLARAALATVAFTLPAAYANAQEFKTKFSGFNEVGALNAETGAILSDGTATLTLKVDKAASTATYSLTFSGLSAPVTQAHIHFGKVHVPGGVIVFLCTNLNNGPAGTQLCPAGGGTVTGTLMAGSVVGPAAQNILAGDFDGLTDALESNTAYGNIHTTKFPAGEIRGQLRRDRDKDDDDDHH